MAVDLRFFAAARAAAGAGALAVTVPDGATIASTLDAVCATTPNLSPVIARCSFLLNGVTAPAEATVADGDTVDVLPPFAGG